MSAPGGPTGARGVVRLLNTSGGRLLCLAGQVDVAAVADFVARYGREPVRVDAIDAGSVTALSPSGVELLLDHLTVAELAGRRVPLRGSTPVDRALTAAGTAGRW
ncbi:hypothetical protein [Modestobacter roseus]|uniref:STAS domain-containing protein n=1 Tax=Modestobacter roseus TaxID=1181884 RepID=A0A562IQF7_9ACTN|nr:hypothetical protein [Modestobacter roseus]MQA33191.1 hypothetical protein [Modestobacter roseus]TWH73257.1 hypothetical protein JD78_01780 [Modestobacter roseus]